MTSAPVVVGVDGSLCADAALRWAADLALDLGAQVLAVHALGLLAHLDGDVVPAEKSRGQVATALEQKWTAPLREAGVGHRCLLVEGNPVTALIAAADAHGARLLVVGSRGTGGFPGLQLGSTSHQLAQHSRVPVVIVPHTG